MTELKAAREPREPEIVYRDADLLVVDKPSGLPTTSPDGENCLASWARAHEPDAERMHPSSRLDAEVTGLVTFARTSRAIERLTAARRAGEYRRFYLGLAARAPEPHEGEWRFPIGRDPRDARKRVALPEGSSVRSAHAPRKAASGASCLADQAWSRYRTLCRSDNVSLLLLQPETGRTHQLRVHAAKAGAALYGDKPYGGAARVVMSDGRVHAARRVMLHCTQLVLPSGGAAPLVLRAPVPPDMRSFFTALGGDEGWLDPERWTAGWTFGF